VDLSDNALGPSGAQALGELLRRNHSIRTLRVHNDGLGQDGGKHIAAALLGKSGIEEEEDVEPENIAKIETFISGRNRLENPGAEALANTFKLMKTLTALQIPQNGIKPEGIVFIAESLKQNKGLMILDLNDNNIRESGAIALAAAFKELPELRKVNRTFSPSPLSHSSFALLLSPSFCDKP
jgi:Ran GTPase-activating protein 1